MECKFENKLIIHFNLVVHMYAQKGLNHKDVFLRFIVIKSLIVNNNRYA
jgi:hypothetical protein